MEEKNYRVEGDTLVINDGVTAVEGKDFHICDDYRFLVKQGLENIKKVIVPDSVAIIGEDAFYDFQSLEDISLPNSITNIGDNAFFRCKSLTSISIPDSVTSIGEFALAECMSLESVTISDKLFKITEDNTFLNCMNLKNLTITDELGSETIVDENNYYIKGDTAIFKDGVKTIEYGDLHNVDKPAEMSKFETAMKALLPRSIIKAELEDITNVILPSSVTSIGDKAFEWCKRLERVTIPDSVTSIGERAFRNCSFEDITIPDGVTNIGKEAFAFCENLEHIAIPDGVTSISDYTFGGCTSLKSITIPNSVINIGKNVFDFCGNLTIKCNKGSYAEGYAKDRHIPVEHLENKSLKKSNKKDNIERG